MKTIDQWILTMVLIIVTVVTYTILLNYLG